MHIGVITTGYPHRHDPVSGMFVREMARALAARGHFLTVLCAERMADSPLLDSGVDVRTVRYLPRWIERGTFHDEGAPDRLGRGDPIAWIGAITFPPALLACARDILRPCGALISHFIVPCAPIASLIRGDRRHHAFAHGTDARWAARMPKILQRALLRGCTSLHVATQRAFDRLANAIPDETNVTVGPVGWTSSPVDRPSIEGLRDRLLGDRGQVLVVAIGRIVEVKGFDLLIEAARVLSQQGSSFRIVVAGDGPLRHEFERRSPSNVTWLGAVDSLTRDVLLNAADLVAIPSRQHEGAPVAMLEAMGAGRAVIASDVQTLREVGGSSVRYVSDRSHSEWAQAIVELSRSRVTRDALGAAAQKRVEPMKWIHRAEQIERLLSATDARSASPPEVSIETPSWADRDSRAD
jgi:glycosyltransferase involved in cell wall biosynthesis